MKENGVMHTWDREGRKKLDKGSWRQIERASGREKERATMAKNELREREGEREEETGGVEFSRVHAPYIMKDESDY